MPRPDFEEALQEDPNIDGDVKSRLKKYFNKILSGKVFFDPSEASYSKTLAKNLYVTKCYTCGDIAVWVFDGVVFPPLRSGPEPNEDLPVELKSTFEEARSIFNLSPRGAAALLRLCIQNLCIHLGERGKNINEDIGSLVKKGLDEKVQVAMDYVRVIGNNAVHPGQIDLRDDRDTAESLFDLINLVAESLITEPRRVKELFAGLPQSAKDQIAKRDKNNAKNNP